MITAFLLLLYVYVGVTGLILAALFYQEDSRQGNTMSPAGFILVIAASMLVGWVVIPVSIYNGKLGLTK